MTILALAWAAFNTAYDRYPFDAMHPARVEAREALWFAQHDDWIDPPLIMETPF